MLDLELFLRGHFWVALPPRACSATLAKSSSKPMAFSLSHLRIGFPAKSAFFFGVPRKKKESRTRQREVGVVCSGFNWELAIMCSWCLVVSKAKQKGDHCILMVSHDHGTRFPRNYSSQQCKHCVCQNSFFFTSLGIDLHNTFCCIFAAQTYKRDRGKQKQPPTPQPSTIPNSQPRSNSQQQLDPRDSDVPFPRVAYCLRPGLS